MRRISIVALGAILLGACSDGVETPTQPDASPGDAMLSVSGSGDFVEGRLLVRFRPGANAQALLAAHGASIDRPIALGIQLLRVPVGRELTVASALSKNPNVEFAEPDFFRTLGDPCESCTPDDPYFGYKWDLHNDGAITTSGGMVEERTGAVDADIDWLEAYRHLGGSLTGSALIGIGDSGVRATHQDLAGKVFAMRDFHGTTSGADDYGHGTHVAGIAAAHGGNGAGVPGVAWGPNVKILSAKMCGPGGRGPFASYGCPSSAITEGIKWLAEAGADVINLSLGGPSGSSSEQAALQYAVAEGSLIFCASGNDNGSVSYPGAFPECVAVGATNWGDTRASYSNYGPQVELSAPGGDSETDTGRSYILSAYHEADNDYVFMAGTSMASPQAAGLAALLKALGAKSGAEILSIMKNTADDLGSSKRDDYFGEGRINVYRAVQALVGGGGDPSPTNDPPTAAFSSICDGLTCTFNGSGSSDPDGSIASYAWAFGDEITGSGTTATHTYAADGSYSVTLTVTDDEGATGIHTQSVTVTAPSTDGIVLTATGYKVQGFKHVDLSWTGANGSPVDVKRNGNTVATVSDEDHFTYNTGARGGGSETYQVCKAGTSTCSNQVTVTF